MDSLHWCNAYGGKLDLDAGANTITTAYYDLEHTRSNQYDSANTIAVYELSGELKEAMMPLPHLYWNKRLVYNFLYSWTAVTAGHTLYTLYSYIPRIFDVRRRTGFDLKGIPEYANNDTFFVQASHSPNIESGELVRYAHLQLGGLYSTNRSTLMVIGAWDDPRDSNENRTWFAQEYSVDGKLLQMRILPETSDQGNVMYMGYSQPEQSVLVFRLSKVKGWDITHYQWDAR